MSYNAAKKRAARKKAAKRRTFKEASKKNEEVILYICTACTMLCIDNFWEGISERARDFIANISK